MFQRKNNSNIFLIKRKFRCVTSSRIISVYVEVFAKKSGNIFSRGYYFSFAASMDLSNVSCVVVMLYFFHWGTKNTFMCWILMCEKFERHFWSEYNSVSTIIKIILQFCAQVLLIAKNKDWIMSKFNLEIWRLSRQTLAFVISVYPHFCVWYYTEMTIIHRND